MEAEGPARRQSQGLAPTGQYDPTKLINWGTNRWSFKPEFGYSQRWGQMDCRWLRWRVVLHHQSRLLVAQFYYPGTSLKPKDPSAPLKVT